MAYHLCWECAAAANYLTGIKTGRLLDTTYQFGKFIKHTTPLWVPNTNSLFNDASTGVYEDYVVNTASSGSLEVDDQGRTNFIWCAGKHTGVTLENGAFQHDNDSMKLVLPYDSDKIHAFSVSSTGYLTLTCRQCGRAIPG